MTRGYARPAGPPVTRAGWPITDNTRPMIERTIAWLTRGNRRLRYRGVTKNDHWLHHRAAALNLRRLVTLVWPTTAWRGHCPKPLHHANT